MLRRPARLFVPLVLAIFVIDQVTKSLVRVLWGDPKSAIFLDALVGRITHAAHPSGASVRVLGRVLELTYVANAGAAFGLMQGRQRIFVTTSVIVLGAIGAYWWRTRPRDWRVVVALALVSAGALGNLVDRALLGRVTDFIYIAIIDFPVFNVADAAINVGVAVLALWMFLVPETRSHAGSESHGDAAQVTGDSHEL